MADFEFSITPQDHEDIRWYLEDYLDGDSEPAPSIAARVERRMTQIGQDLFSAIFHANDRMQQIWAAGQAAKDVRAQ